MKEFLVTIFALQTVLTASGKEAQYEPAGLRIPTEWAGKVTPDNAWREYPRPNLVRPQWQCLNGLWDYRVTSGTQTSRPDSWEGKILVPFAIESALSGVKGVLTPDDALWYQRQVDVSAKPGKRHLLHFEAVDYECTLWINDKKIGEHTGGNLPFSFDITDALGSEPVTLTLRVKDASDLGYQLHGKQRLHPAAVFYTAVSGIWKTVWMEEVPELHITALKLTTTMDGKVDLGISLSDGKTAAATVVASLDGKEVARASGQSDSISLTIPEPKLWSPASPTLYDLKIEVGDDVVTSYTGVREVGREKDADGHWRFTLNGKPIFHWGVLDQGWWPDGLLTPPSEEAMVSDILFLKKAGYNTIRKHIKVEPRSYYYHCDKIGMLVWQDQVSNGIGRRRGEGTSSSLWTRLEPDPVEVIWPDEAHDQYMAELKTMIDTLHNHPSIVQWVPFNEAWGQHRTPEVGKWAVDYDPTRHINVASGGNFFPVGHIVDAHLYPHPAFPFEQGEGGRFDDFVKVMGEFGGHGFPVPGHLWNPKEKNWGYGELAKEKKAWLARYRKSIDMLAGLRKQGIAAGIYTQTSDVEGEINGILTYDRKVKKATAETLAEIHREAGF